jgi:hypothetical protein
MLHRNRLAACNRVWGRVSHTLRMRSWIAFNLLLPPPGRASCYGNDARGTTAFSR